MGTRLVEIRFATLAIVAASLSFALSSGMAKNAVTEVHPIEVFFLRNLAAIAPMILVAGLNGGQLRVLPSLHSRLLLRGILVTASLVFLFQALKELNVATAMAIHLAAIPMAAIVSVFVRRSAMGRRSAVLMILVGFAGVLLIIRPYELEASFALYCAVVSAVLACASQLMLGHLSRRESASTITLHLYVVGTVLIAPFLPFIWSWPSPIIILALIGAGGFAWLAQLLTVHAVALSSNSYIAPFQYLVVVAGFGFDVLFWRTSVTGPAMVGAVLVMVGALICFFATTGAIRRNQVLQGRNIHAA